MPWRECTVMSLRSEFVRLATQEGANISALCRRFDISRKTAYKWLKRYQQEGLDGLKDRSRRPRSSPRRTSPSVEAAVLEARQAHPAWGGRKIQSWLLARGQVVPASPNTVTAILRRHGLIDPEEARKHRPFERFEAAEPNELWQMDFKGYFPLGEGGYCHPLTLIDDHSRYLLGLWACPDETQATVRARLIQVFREYGLPQRILVDNGPPWGDGADNPYTLLTVWLIRLGIRVTHSSAYHPQTLGKDERLHRTLQEEVLERHACSTLEDWQGIFTPWRDIYNYERPHEALGMQTPASRYRPSPRPYPEVLPPIVYEPSDIVRKVDVSGRISFQNRVFRVGKAFRHQPVCVRPTDRDGEYAVFFCQQQIGRIDLRCEESRHV